MKKQEYLNRVKILFNKGVKAEKQGEMDMALNIYKMVLKMDGEFREAYINLGNLLSRSKKYRFALASFKKALKLKKDFAILFNLGVLFYKIRRFKSAKYMFEQALNLNQNFIRVHLLLGFTCSQLKELSCAEKAYQNVLTIEPMHPQAIYALTYLYLHKKQYPDALQFAEKLISLDPKSPEIQNLYAKISFYSEESGSLDEALMAKSLEKMVLEETSFQEYNEFIVKAQKKEPVKYQKLNQEIQKKIKELKSEYDNRKKLDTKAWFNLSLYYLFQGKPQKAVKALSKARAQISA